MKHIKINKLVFKRPVTAGMNILVISSLALHYKGSREDVEPIIVRKKGKYYRVIDGRHRVVASMLAGRDTVLAIQQLRPNKSGTKLK